MEVSVRIDCTPGEARRLIGAPDLPPLCQLPCVALEDFHPQRIFEHTHMMAHGGGRDRELCGSFLDAEMARCCFKRAQRVQRR